MIDCVRTLPSKHGWLLLLLLGLPGWPSPAAAMTGNEWRARTSYVTGSSTTSWTSGRPCARSSPRRGARRARKC